MSQEWADGDLSVLRQHYDPRNVDLVAAMLPAKKRKAITQKAFELGLSKKKNLWEAWEDDIIRRYYSEMESPQIQEKFLPHRSPKLIQARGRKLGLIKSKRWTEGEDQILRRHYQGFDWDLMFSLLPGRTKHAIMDRSRDLGLTQEMYSDPWQEWEERILRESYTNKLDEEIQQLLPNRSLSAIAHKAHRLGLARSRDEIRWTKEEKEILRSHYGQLSYPQMVALIPGRSAVAIQGMAGCMGLAKLAGKKEAAPWTEAEDEIVRRYYKDIGSKRTAAMLPGRTPQAVSCRAKKLSVRIRYYWTEEEDQIISRYYSQELRVPEGELPGRTQIAIIYRAYQLGFRPGPLPWSEEEDKILCTNYGKKPASELCYLLPGRTRGAIVARAEHLNLQTEAVPRWTEAEDQIILENYLHLIAKDLKALLPGRGVFATYNRAQRLGLQKAFSGFVPRAYRSYAIHYNRYTVEELRSRFNHFADRCPYCHNSINFDERVSFEWDHFIPVSKGGSDVLGNLIPCCPSCNSRKHAADPYEWFKRQPFFSEKRWQHILRALGKKHETYAQIPLV